MTEIVHNRPKSLDQWMLLREAINISGNLFQLRKIYLWTAADQELQFFRSEESDCITITDLVYKST